MLKKRGKAPLLRGFCSTLAAKQLVLKPAADQPGNTNQSCTQEPQGAGFRDNDIGVATGDHCGSVEESLTGVNGKLNRHTICREPQQTSTDDACQGVVVRAVWERYQTPRHWTAERTAENHSVGNPVAAVTGDRESATGGEGPTHS